MWCAADEIEYSEKYDDGLYEYRHVILPRKVSQTAQFTPQTAGWMALYACNLLWVPGLCGGAFRSIKRPWTPATEQGANC